MSTAVCGAPPHNIGTLNEFVNWINTTYQLKVPPLPVFPTGTVLELGNLSVTEFCRPGREGLEVEARAKKDLTLVPNVMIKEVFIGVRKLSTADATG